MTEKVERSGKIHETDQNPEVCSIKTYLIANSIFWIWLLVMYLIALLLIRDTKGLVFVLGVLGVCFSIVSIADYVFDHLVDNE